MTDNSLKILMVEDDPDHAHLSKYCLEKSSNHSVNIVGSYSECCQVLKDRNFDIILLDYDLPNEDGVTILKRLKNEKNIETPIVVVTGHGHEKIAVEAMKAGAFDYVIKSKGYPKILPSVVKKVTEKHYIHQEKKRMEKEILIRNQELHALNALSEVLIQSLDLEVILNGAVDKIVQLLELNACAIYTKDSRNNTLLLKARIAPLNVLNSFQRIDSDSVDFFDNLISEGKPIIYNSISELNSIFFNELKEANINAFLFVPLKHKTDILGTLFVASEKKDFFTSRQIKLITSICNQISMAIKNANLYSELSGTKNELENVLNSSLDLIITLGADGSLKFYNERFAKNYAYSNHALNGKNIFEYVPENCKNLIKKKIEELKHDRSSIYETELLNADGTNMHCMISQSPLKGREEFLMVIKDTSQIVNLQKQLMQSEKLSALGQLISGVAHELNNPLAGILGFTQLLLEENIPSPIREDLHVICKEAKRCQKIVKNLLTFARKHNSSHQHIDVNEVLNSILDLQQYHFKLESIELIQKYDSNLPKIVGDYDQLQQVFLNLINNALYALKSSSKADKQLIVSTEQVKNLIRIKITDNGIGISQQDKQRIFDPFFTTKEVGAGTGLGLSICFGIIQSHQGNLFVESELGSGSTFILEFTVIE